jgi:PAS domain S-box-containing protein
VNLRHLALVPGAVLAASIFVTLFFDFSKMFVLNPPYLLLELNLIFWAGATAAIAYVSAKSYRKDGSLTVLLLSSSIIIFGISVIVSGWVGTFSGDYSVAVSNPCILAASILQVLSSILSFTKRQESRISNKKVLLTTAYLASVILVVANSIVVLLGYMPAFFIASGPTLLRQAVLGSAVFLLAVASLIFGVQYMKSKSPSLYLYAIAIGLFSIGLFSAFEVKVLGDVPTWLGRLTLYLGASYLIAAILASRKKSGAGTDLAGSWTEAFRSDRGQVATLFSKMLDAFVYGKVVVDENGKPVDCVFLEVNDIFEQITGIKKENAIGKKATELLPGVQNDPAGWISIYGRVAVTGESIQFENFLEPLKKWYHVSSYSPKKGYFVSIFEDITERKQAEETLKKAKEQYALLFNSVNEGFANYRAVYDENGRLNDLLVLEINPAGANYSGVKREDQIGKTWRQVWVGIDDSTFEFYRKVDQTGSPFSFEHFSNITNRWYGVEIYKISKDQFAATFTDITERKKAERDVLEQKVRAERYLNIVGNIILALDVQGKITLLNKKGYKILGYEEGELYGKDWVDTCLPKEIRAAFRKDFDDWVQGKTKAPENYENAIVTKYGEKRIVSWHNTEIRDKNEQLIETLSSGEDISERKEAEEKLEEYRRNLEKLVEERTKKLGRSSLYARNLIEASLDPLVTISVEGKITDVNKATEIATGCSRHELIGSDFSDYFTEPEKAKIGYKQVFTKGFVRDYPLAIRHKSGRITDVSYNATVYRSAAGEIQGVFAAARDVTELKKAEEQAQEAAKKLKDAERLAAIGATAGMVGHDIRNPLQAIIGDLYLAREEVKEIPNSEGRQAMQESLDEIEKNVDYINKIVADLQDFARPLSPHAELVDLKLIIDELLTKNGLPENIKLSVKVESEARKVVADSSYINRIMYNLVTNAVQAMPEGGKLTIHTSKEANDVVISVKDTGVGIPEKVRDKLFTPMFTTKAKGQGFGLAVIRRMTEALGGTVTFESQEGKGTTFIVNLPHKKGK